MEQTLNWNDELAQKEQTFSRFMQGVRTFWDLVSSEKKNIRLLFGAICLAKGIEFLAPYVLKLIFDAAQEVLNGNAGMQLVWYYTALTLVVGVVSEVFSRYVRAPLFFVTAIRLEKELPIVAHRKLLALSQGYHARNSIGKNSAKITKGCEKVVAIADRLAWGLIPSLVYMVINVAILLVLDWRLGAVFLALSVPAAWLNLKSYEKFHPGYLEWDKLKEKANARFFDTHRNGATVRDFVAERFEEKRFSTVRTNMYDLDIKLTWRIQAYLLAVGIGMHLAFLCTVILSIYFALTGTITLGTAVFVAMTTNVTKQGIWDSINSYTHIMRDIVSVERLAQLLREREDVCNMSTEILDGESPGRITYNRVEFGYKNDNAPIFAGLSVDVSPGEMLALVGVSGSGKTTFGKLLSRVYDVTGGSITLNGVDIRSLDRDWYRRRFAIVSQSVEIFDTTIRENVAYGNFGATDKEVEEALKAAHLDTALKDTGRFPKGTGTRVGESGVQLSGGERQRVGIARAYLALTKGAKVLILDEATSALDSHAERVIQEFVERLQRESSITIVVVAHRLSTIKRADRILVFEKGHIIESGTHKSLLAINGRYAQLVRLQSLGAVRD